MGVSIVDRRNPTPPASGGTLKMVPRNAEDPDGSETPSIKTTGEMPRGLYGPAHDSVANPRREANSVTMVLE